MRWLLSIFRIRGGPVPLRELPSFLAKLVVFGAVTGPFWAAFFMMFGYPEGALQIFVNPVALFWASLTGVIFALCFGTVCGLGNGYLRGLLKGYPPAIVGTIYIVYNAVGCSLACMLSFAIVMHLPGTGVKIEIPFLWAIVATDGIIGAILALIIGAFIKLKIQVECTQKKLSEMAVTASQAQARALQSQINPHFFFNTLNTISALVEEDPAAAREMVGRLSDLFRYTLGCTCSDAVTLGEEVQFVRDYLSIESARFRKRLRVELPDGELPDVRIPGLVLQPLVENAIKHGIAPLIDGGSVRVRVEGAGDRFRVSVRNTADEHALPDGAAMFRPGHALDNVRARLRIFTGEEEPLLVRRGTDWVEFSFEAPAA
ncbi:MAG TPA: histidine kinase [Bryobacteraceae bacterium]|nr:histidine kinase [Bryobacteraceae bacterium]